MATRTSPLISAATLASAAAIAVASPAIVPSLNIPSPHALAAAKVQLTTFADVLSIPTVQWTDLLFGNTDWGGVLSDENYGPAWAEPQDFLVQPGYVNPWASACAGRCTSSGPSGALYLFFDALINGDGNGWDPENPGAGWSTGVVNYLFEPSSVFILGGGSSPYLQYVNEGWSAAAWYILQGMFGQTDGEANQLSVPIAALFWGPTNLTVGYNAILTAAAAVLNAVPVVGPLAGNSILAYLGDLPIPDSGGAYYQYGLSGALNYWIDIATGAVPFPTATQSTADSAAAAAATTLTAAEAAPATDAAEVAAGEAADAAKVADGPSATVVASTTEAETPAVTGPATTDANATTPDVPAPAAPITEPAAPAAETTTPSTADTGSVPAETATPAAETTTPAADTTPEATDLKVDTPAETTAPEIDIPKVDTTSASDVTDNAPAKAPAAPKRPIRDAVEKVGKQITSAINGAKEAKAAKAGATAKASASDSDS